MGCFLELVLGCWGVMSLRVIGLVGRCSFVYEVVFLLVGAVVSLRTVGAILGLGSLVWLRCLETLLVVLSYGLYQGVSWCFGFLVCVFFAVRASRFIMLMTFSAWFFRGLVGCDFGMWFLWVLVVGRFCC